MYVQLKKLFIYLTFIYSLVIILISFGTEIKLNIPSLFTKMKL